ncbi:hypothetical protein PQR15_22890 [Streptomyces lydicus]|nr:hypothetical protein [Streptomyces lydicus]
MPAPAAVRPRRITLGAGDVRGAGIVERDPGRDGALARRPPRTSSAGTRTDRSRARRVPRCSSAGPTRTPAPHPPSSAR